MLALDNPRWASFTHAYGSAANIPELLEKLAKETAPSDKYDDEPWFSLWSALCHQGDVYDASYAAVPHVVMHSATCGITNRFQLLSASCGNRNRTLCGAWTRDTG